MTDQAIENVEAVAETPVIDKVELTKAEYDKLLADVKERDTLKAHHDKVAQEKKDAIAKAAKDKAEAEGDLKKLLELKDEEYKNALAEREQKITAYEERERSAQVNKVADQLARELATHKGRADHLAEKLAQRLKLTEDGVKVTDGKGNIVSDKLDTLKDYAKKELDFLCDGLQSTGGAGVVAIKPTGTKEQVKSGDPADTLNAIFGSK